MHRKKMIESIHMQTQKDRIIPFFFVSFYFFAMNYLIRDFNLSEPLPSIFFGLAMSASFAFLINFIYKMSIHMMGMGGVFGLLYGFTQVFQLNLVLGLALVLMGLSQLCRLTFFVSALLLMILLTGMGVGAFK